MERKYLIDGIMKLVEKADVRVLRLVYIHFKALLGM